MKTISKLFPLQALATALLLAACASAPPPPWAATPQAISQVYPDKQYIARKGRGPTREAAEASGAAEIARYLESRVSATMGYSDNSVQSGGKTRETLSTTNEAYVKTQMKLFGIRYADDAYYNKAEKEWQTVAYIDRAEAWTVYEPRFKRQAASFENLYRAAKNERAPVKRALRYFAAQHYAQSPDFRNANSFGQMLAPDKMNREFAAVRNELSELPEKADSAKRAAPVYIDCPLDFESLVADAFSDSFSAQGFPVAKRKNAASAVCAVSVDEGEQKRDIGVFYYPSLQAVLRDSSGTLCTFTFKGKKEAAVTPDVAKRRAYTALAEEVKANFASQFEMK